MRRPRRTIAALALLAALVGGAAPAAADGPCRDPARPTPGAGPSQDREGGIGGTGLGGDDSGIGGTGLGGDDSGIGGTGIRGDEDGIGGTGIFGTVTRVGGLCVNGLPIEYGDELQVWFSGVAGTTADLAVGQVVWVEATERSGRLEAQKISIVSAVVGPVTAVEPGVGLIEVSGRAVEVPEVAIVFGSPAGLEAGLSPFAMGEVVAVYGLRRPDGRVIASRIDRAQGLAAQARLVEPRLERLLRASPQVRSLSVEGYLEPLGAGARFRIDGLDVDAADVTRAGALLETGARVWLRGPVAPDRTLRVQQVTPLPPELRAPPLARGGALEPWHGAPPPGRRADELTQPGEIRTRNPLQAADTTWHEVQDPPAPPEAAGVPLRPVVGVPSTAIPVPVRDRPIPSDLGIQPRPIDAILSAEPSPSAGSGR
jgi:hypothetical protein